MLLLASASPRRRELLCADRRAARGAVADIDETPRAGEAVDGLRAAAGARQGGTCTGLAAATASLPVLGADTAVVLDGEMLGKPRDRGAGAGDAARACRAARTRC